MLDNKKQVSMKITIIITSFNQLDYLKQAINSALAQTLSPYQIVIVDDCSTDNTQDLISDYAHQYPDLITPIYHSANTGVAQVRVDGLHAVKGDYVTFLDGDDRYLPEKLEKESNAIKNTPDAKIAFSNFFYIDKDGERMQCWAENELVPQGNVFIQTFSRNFPKNTLFRSEFVEYNKWKEVGFYDPNLQIYEDYEMKIRLTRNMKVVYTGKPLCEYRIHEMGLSKAEMDIHIEAFKYIFQKNKHFLNKLPSEQKRYVVNKIYKRLFMFSMIKAKHCLKDRKNMEAIRYLLNSLYYKAGLGL